MHLEPWEINLLALVIVVMFLYALFAFIRGKLKATVETPLAKISIEGENPPPPAKIPGGVKITDAESGARIIARSTGEGGVELEKVKAEGDIDESPDVKTVRAKSTE